MTWHLPKPMNTRASIPIEALAIIYPGQETISMDANINDNCELLESLPEIVNYKSIAILISSIPQYPYRYNSHEFKQLIIIVKSISYLNSAIECDNSRFNRAIVPLFHKCSFIANCHNHSCLIIHSPINRPNP